MRDKVLRAGQSRSDGDHICGSRRVGMAAEQQGLAPDCVTDVIVSADNASQHRGVTEERLARPLECHESALPGLT